MQRCSSFSSKKKMSFGDSKAVFEQRAKAIGLEDAVVTCFREKSLDTMAKFAFSCNYSPGGSDDKPFRDLLTKVASSEVAKKIVFRFFLMIFYDFNMVLVYGFDFWHFLVYDFDMIFFMVYFMKMKDFFL